MESHGDCHQRSSKNAGMVISDNAQREAQPYCQACVLGIERRRHLPSKQFLPSVRQLHVYSLNEQLLYLARLRGHETSHREERLGRRWTRLLHAEVGAGSSVRTVNSMRRPQLIARVLDLSMKVHKPLNSGVPDLHRRL